MPRSHQSSKKWEVNEDIPYQLPGMTKILSTRDQTTKNTRDLPLHGELLPPQQTPPQKPSRHQNRGTDISKGLPIRERGKDALEGQVWKSARTNTPAPPVQSPEVALAPQATTTDPQRTDTQLPDVLATRSKEAFLAFCFIAFTWLSMFFLPSLVSHLRGHWGLRATSPSVFSLSPNLPAWSEQLGGHLNLEVSTRHEGGKRAKWVLESLAVNMTRLTRERETLPPETWDAVLALPDAIRSKNATSVKHCLHLVLSSTQSMRESLRLMDVQFKTSDKIVSEVADAARSAKEFHRGNKIAAFHAGDNTAWKESDDLRAEYDRIEQYARQTCLLVRDGRTHIRVEREVEDKYYDLLARLLNDTTSADSGGDTAVDWDELSQALAATTIELASHKEIEKPRGYQRLLEEINQSQQERKDEYIGKG